MLRTRKIRAIALIVNFIFLLTGCAAKQRVAVSVPGEVERSVTPDDQKNGRVGPAEIYPDPRITPGATALDVTQENINETICVSGFTKPPRRPPSSYTNWLKMKGFNDYGLTGRRKKEYEEDHLIPLELGGDPRDPKNLWPEPYHTSILDGGARYKDLDERYLNRQVCNGQKSLAEAQKAIRTDWYQVYQSMPYK